LERDRLGFTPRRPLGREKEFGLSFAIKPHDQLKSDAILAHSPMVVYGCSFSYSRPERIVEHAGFTALPTLPEMLIRLLENWREPVRALPDQPQYGGGRRILAEAPAVEYLS
jgi:hypothetical protein